MWFSDDNDIIDINTLPKMSNVSAAIFVTVAIASMVISIYVPIALSVLLACGASAFSVCLWLFFRRRYIYVLLLSPILFATIFYLCTSSPNDSFLKLYCIGVIYIFSLFTVYDGVILKYSCSKTIIYTAVCYGVTILVIIVITYLLNPVMLKSSAEYIIEDIHNWLTSIRINSPSGKIPLFSEESATEYINYIIYILPSLIALLLMSIAAVSAKFSYILLSAFSQTEILSDEKWLIKSNLAGAIIYTCAYVMSFFFATSYGMEIFYYSAENIVIIFTPALFLTGFRAALERLCRNSEGGSLKLLWILIFCLFLFAATSFTCAVFSFIGAAGIIKTKIKKIHN